MSTMAGRRISAYKLASVSYDPRNGFPDRDMCPYFAEANHDVEHRLHGDYGVAILHHGFLSAKLREHLNDVLQ
jgi:hypothetical protein